MTTEHNFPSLPRGQVMGTGVINGRKVELVRYTADQMRAYVLADRARRVEFAEVLEEAGVPNWRIPEAHDREMLIALVKAGLRSQHLGAQRVEQVEPVAWPKLEAPARVGGGTFGVGVSSRLVVEAAQRQFDIEGVRQAMTSEELQEQERTRREVWDLINGSPATPPASAPAGDGGDYISRLSGLVKEHRREVFVLVQFDDGGVFTIKVTKKT